MPACAENQRRADRSQITVGDLELLDHHPALDGRDRGGHHRLDRHVIRYVHEPDGATGHHERGEVLGTALAGRCAERDVEDDVFPEWVQQRQILIGVPAGTPGGQIPLSAHRGGARPRIAPVAVATSWPTRPRPPTISTTAGCALRRADGGQIDRLVV